MIANILQLAAGMLLAISSFIVKNTSFQVPFFGEKLPGTLERLKQVWVIRIGLLLLVLGYTLPIINLDILLAGDFPRISRFIIGFGSSLILVGLGYWIAVSLAKRDYDKAPVFTENSPASPGMIVYEKVEK